MKTEQEIISHLLSTIEAQIDAGVELHPDELDEYVVAAIWAHKKYGRSCPHVEQIVNDREGISIHALSEAGLTYEDYRAAYAYRKSA